jgi:hypothetical protein
VYWELVKQQQANVDIECVGMINTDDLEQTPPHFVSASYDTIGRRMADRLIEIGCEP